MIVNQYRSLKSTKKIKFLGEISKQNPSDSWTVKSQHNTFSETKKTSDAKKILEKHIGKWLEMRYKENIKLSKDKRFSKNW